MEQLLDLFRSNFGRLRLAEDLSETTNLTTTNPLLAKRMQTGLEDWIRSIDATTPSPLDRRPKRNPRAGVKR